MSEDLHTFDVGKWDDASFGGKRSALSGLTHHTLTVRFEWSSDREPPDVTVLRSFCLEPKPFHLRAPSGLDADREYWVESFTIEYVTGRRWYRAAFYIVDQYGR